MITMQTGRRQERIIEIAAQSMDIWSPSVSSIAPTYNSGEIKVIITDGGSSDSILEITGNFEEV